MGNGHLYKHYKFENPYFCETHKTKPKELNQPTKSEILRNCQGSP